jgi:hypothetical protein
VDANFIPADPTHLTTPINAILSAGGDSLLVSDFAENVVQEYDMNGNYLGVFAPAGGPITTVAQSILGIALRPNGNLLVTVSGGANDDAVAEFNTAGVYVGDFITNTAGGLNAPFDITQRPGILWMVSGNANDAVLHFNLTTGAFITPLAAVNDSPVQVALARNGNVLVANSSGTQAGIVEFSPTGGLVDVITATGLSGYRGVYELPDLNLLVTTGSGVFEINRAGTVVITKTSGVSAWYVESVRVGGIRLAKTVGINPAACATSDTLTVTVGTLVTYCYQITNTGGTTLTRHTLVDNRLGTILNDFPFSLVPGASAFLTQSVVLTTTTVNTATWTAFNPGPTDVVSATSVATVTAVPPSVSLAKTVGTNPLTCATTDMITVTVGTLVTYCYEIRNTGPITLTRHTLVDNRIGTILNDFSYSLAPGAGAFLTHSLVLTMTTVNTATWTAYNPGPVNAASSTDQARVAVLRKVYLPVVGR